ncbi:MAG: hypothetical protein IJY25_04655 [Bacilli bacterium]|nr:hypothetical protein [Bacilli bacterium]
MIIMLMIIFWISIVDANYSSDFLFDIFIIFRFPCSTTLITIYKETKSIKWTFLSFLIPLLIDIMICMIVNFIGTIII